MAATSEPPSERVGGSAPVPRLGMSAEDFRSFGHRLVDWVADLQDRLEELPTAPDVAPGDLRARLPAHAPEAPEAFDAVLEDLERVVVPGLVGWQSPRWFAYFPTGASFPSILADLVTAGIGQQGMLWSTSPITTELEAHVLDWLVELLGLPSSWRSDGPGGGVLQMSASDSTHTALVAARHRTGASPSDVVAYASTQAHSSIEKGARVAGYGHVQLVDVDERFALRVDAFEEAVAADRAAGLVPAFVCAAIGTTGTTAVDPVRAVGEVARRERVWLHVDAAYAGAAMLCEEHRHHQDGLELADSYTWNPHKWMAVGFDCSVLHVADRRPLLDALTILPPYLRNVASDSGAVLDYRDWHVPLGRRPRALKLWFVLRAYGVEGLRALVREHVALAQELAARIQADPRLELVAPTPFGLVSFRHVGGDDATRDLAAAVNATRRFTVTPSVVRGPATGGRDVAFVRVSIGAALTERRHVDELWALVDEVAEPAPDARGDGARR